MRWFRFAGLVLVTTVLQANLNAAVGLTIKPDLLLILLVFFAIYSGTSEAIVISFAIGFAAELIGGVMGPKIISYGLLGTLLAYLHRIVAIRKMPYQSLAVFVICFLAGLSVLLLSSLKDQPIQSGIYESLFWKSVYSSLAGPFIFLPVAWWMQIKTHRFGQQS